MRKYLFFSIFNCLFLVLTLFAVYFCIIHLTKFDILFQHDLVFSYGRTFMEPEHGRYIATYFNNLLTEILPEYLNIHPNDFKPLVVSPFKAILVIIICLLISFSAFLYKEIKQGDLNKIIFTPAYTSTFVICFLNLFNNYFFSDVELSFFAIRETTVFFEYSCSLFAFIPFISYIAYFYINNKTPNKKQFAIIYLLSFLTSISIDPINLPTFIAISILSLVSLLTNRQHLCNKKKEIFLWGGVYITYIIGLFIYFIRPQHHTISYGTANNLIEYIKTYFNIYINEYANIFIKEHSLFLIPILFLLMATFYMAKSNLKTKRLVTYITINVFSLVFFYFATFFMGLLNNHIFIIHYSKCIALYKVTIFFFLIMIIGAFIDITTSNQKTSNIIKFLMGIVIIISFHKILLIDNIQSIQQKQSEMKELRKSAYIIEKLTINEKDETVSIPKEFEEYKSKLFLDEHTCSFFQYVKNVHPQVKLLNYKFKNNEKDYYYLFNDEELETLKFQNLLTHKMYRHKKQIIGCY